MDFKKKEDEYYQTASVLGSNEEKAAFRSRAMNDAMEKILNREKFSYDVNGDALYKNYADNYTRNGKLAMKDTVGQVTALTGGYGNSYAQTAGQQVYNGYMQELAGKVPELMQLARSMYDAEGADLMNRYNMLADAENRDYNRSIDERNYNYQLGRDAISDARYTDELAYARGRDAIADERYADERDYARGRDAIADDRYIDERDYARGRDSIEDAKWWSSFQYQKDRDDVADRHWQDTFDYNKDRDKVADDQWQKGYDRQLERDRIGDEQLAAELALSELKTTLSGSGKEETGLQHVGTMSSTQIVEAMQGYQLNGDDDGLAAFLDDCVEAGRMTEQQADQYYATYGIQKEMPGVVDTTVPVIGATNQKAHTFSSAAEYDDPFKKKTGTKTR